MLGINSIIGAGIFLTPGAVIKLAGPLAPLAYILAGLFAGVMALVFASAARYVRTNGASYAYTTAAFGQRVGIYVGVTHAITASIAWGCWRRCSSRRCCEWPSRVRPGRTTTNC